MLNRKRRIFLSTFIIKTDSNPNVLSSNFESSEFLGTMLSTHIIYVAFTISFCFSDVQENGEIFSSDIFSFVSGLSLQSSGINKQHLGQNVLLGSF